MKNNTSGVGSGSVPADVVCSPACGASEAFFMVPTWVLSGIRFPSGDFTAAQLPVVRDLAKKARAGNKDAQERIIRVITNALMDEPML